MGFSVLKLLEASHSQGHRDPVKILGSACQAVSAASDTGCQLLPLVLRT